MFETKTLLNLIDGLTLKNEKSKVQVDFDDEFLVMAEKEFKGLKFIDVQVFKIPLKNILATTVTTQKEVVDKNKSVIGRGVVGGLVFGPAGLILGGISGVGSKKMTKIEFVYIVSYLSSEDEVKNITFEIGSSASNSARSLDKRLKKKLTSIQRSEGVEKILSQNDQTEFLL